MPKPIRKIHTVPLGTSRGFKGIWIPAVIWTDKNLTRDEKLMYAEIDSLDNKNGCYASNYYFAEFFDVTERQVQNYISSLVKKGIISRERKGATGRVLRILKK